MFVIWNIIGDTTYYYGKDRDSHKINEIALHLQSLGLDVWVEEVADNEPIPEKFPTYPIC